MAKKAFVKFGDWNKAINLTSNMNTVIDRSIRTTLMQISARAEAMAVKFMSDQSLKWEPLSRKYLTQKQRKGLSTKILIATSTYFQSITSQTNGYTGFAGVLKQIRNKDGEEIADIAQVHEYGSIGRGIPPRRLWHVVYVEMRKFIKTSRIFETNVIRDLKRGI